MRNSGTVKAIGIGVCLAWSCTLSTAPVLANGDPEPPRIHPYWVDDPLEGIFESPSWDIWSVQVDVRKTPVLFSLITAGSFDPNGGETSLTGETHVSLQLTDPVSQTSQELSLVMTDTTEQLWIDGQSIDEGAWGWSAGIIDGWLGLTIFMGHIDWHILQGLEGHSGPIWLEAELSDTGTGVPDRVSGWVPEPGCLALLAAGAAGLLARRRRPHA